MTLTSKASVAEWLDYVEGRTKPIVGELALFPMLDEVLDSAFEEVKSRMLSNRFRWVCHYSGANPSRMFSDWNNDDLYLEERERNSDMPLQEFQDRSCTFGMYMLKEEVKRLHYFVELRDSLRCRASRKDEVLFLGPTAGGELEAIKVSGPRPLLVMGEGNHALQCEERLLLDRVDFESLPSADLERERPLHYVVISPYIVDQAESVRMAYDRLRLYGFLMFPSGMLAMSDEAEALGMCRRDLFNSNLAVYYKYPGLPEFVGE